MHPCLKSGLLGLVLLAGSRPARAAHPMDARQAEVFASEMAAGDRCWDDRVGLLWSSGDPHDAGHRDHPVRETSYYALGLLLRGRPADLARARRAIDAVLREQILAPHQKWNGTFYRSAEDFEVPPTAIDWKEYDPNWRQFIGTTFALMLEEFGPELPKDLRDRMLLAIGRAADGEQEEGRLKPSYTNISLMHAFLCAFAGQYLNRPDLTQVGADYTEAVYRGYHEHETFEEYNSPTYCGVDFYGLGLWRSLGPTERMRSLGARMESGLWNDLASFYNADLRNLCGPFDRSYGMDMRKYVSIVGLQLRLLLDEDQAPLPPLAGPMDHAGDIYYVPEFILLGSRVPPEAMKEFRAFSGVRQVTRRLPGDREATAWISSNLMIGGEVTQRQRSVSGTSQLHPATIHWRTGPGTVGWINVVHSPRIDAMASARTLEVLATGEVTFHVEAEGIDPANLTKERWVLPGLTLAISSDALTCTVVPSGSGFDVTFHEGAHYRLVAQ